METTINDGVTKRREEERKATNAWAEKRFGLEAGSVVGYNSGSCYDKVWVTSMLAARKVKKAVNRQTCNGGYFHGMSKGGISQGVNGAFEVIC
tara:strand:- start:1581 stop:1859 length:279 start_codon:yes stop_codon:yes gene_type:complete